MSVPVPYHRVMCPRSSLSGFRRTQKPAKLPVVPQQPSFELIGRPLEKSLVSFAKEVFTIFWMNEVKSRSSHENWLQAEPLRLAIAPE